MEYSSDSIPTSLETFEVLGIKKFGAYNEDEQYRYFYMTDADNIWGDSLRFSIFSAVFYILYVVNTDNLFVFYRFLRFSTPFI